MGNNTTFFGSRWFGYQRRMWGVFLCISWIWIGSTHIAEAVLPQGDMHAQLVLGQTALYQGEFEQALQIFTSLTHSNPSDPKGAFFIALTYRWLTRLDPVSTTFQRQFEDAIDRSIQLAKTLLSQDKSHVEALLYLAASYGYRAEYENFLKHNWKHAYNDALKMRDTLEKAKKFPGLLPLDIQLGDGLYNYYAHFYRKKIGWWRFLLSLPRGDKQKGLALLEDVRTEGKYARIEAWYFLIEIYKKDKELAHKALPLCEQLHQTYPRHPFFHTLLAGLYHKNHQWKRSIQTAREILAQAQTHRYYSPYLIYQAKYLIGEAFFFLGNYQDALEFFNEIIASRPQEPSYLLPWSHLRRGTIYYLLGKKELALAEYKVVLRMEDIHHTHKIAQELLKNHQKTR